MTESQIKGNKVERQGNIVRIILPCVDEYMATMVFDRIIAEAKTGLVCIPFQSADHENVTRQGE